MRDSLRILFLITELDTGGAQKALARLLASLNRSRFKPHVACLYHGDKTVAQEIRALGIPLTDLRMQAKWRADALWRLYRLLRRQQPAILHTWMFHANLPGRLLGRLAGVPIVITSRRNVNIGGPARERLLRWTSGLDDAVIAVCELARQAEIERAGAAPHHVATIYNGVDVTAFSRSDPEADARIRDTFDIPADAPLLGAIGRLHPQKDFGTLLAAVAQLRRQVPDAHLLLVGDGELREELVNHARSLGLGDCVTFAGHRTHIPEILAAIDVFTLTSLWEGLPNVILEAMAAGLPVVATRVGGVPEVVVAGETGLLVPPRDPDALSRAIVTLLRDPALRQTMGRAGQERVRHRFSVEQMVRRTESLYERLLAEKGLA